MQPHINDGPKVTEDTQGLSLTYICTYIAEVTVPTQSSSTFSHSVLLLLNIKVSIFCFPICINIPVYTRTPCVCVCTSACTFVCNILSACMHVYDAVSQRACLDSQCRYYNGIVNLFPWACFASLVEIKANRTK